MSRWTARLKALLRSERQSFLAGGRDVVETTRRSFLSLEARAGAALLAALFPLSLVQCPSAGPYPFDPGPAFSRLAAGAAPGFALFALALWLLHGAAGAVLGIFLRNAWDLADEFAPAISRRAWARRFRWILTLGVLLALHGGVLLAALRGRPALYAPAFHDRGGPLRWFQDWLAGGWLSWPGRLWTALAFLVLFAGAAQIARRFRRWFLTFPLPTRVAWGVGGAGALFFYLGLWGVFRFHRSGNQGPNVVVLVVEGLRAEDLKDPERAPALSALAHRSRVFASCVPTVPQREAALMTLLTGRSPLSHGVRHGFPSAGDVALGPDNLPSQLSRAGYETVALSGAGGDLLGRLAPAFRRVRAPDLSVPGLLRRDLLRRCVHLLPYLRGPLARSLRAVPEAADADFIAGEAEALLQQLRFERRFFLLAHFTPERDLGSLDRAVRRVLGVLDDRGLSESTWVVLWSPFAAPSPDEPAVRDVSSPSLFASPLLLAGPSRRLAPRWVQVPVRDMDVAPTLLSAAGLVPAERMEGLPLLELDPDAPDFAGRDIYTESDVWWRPEDNPLPADRRLVYGPPSRWLEEDPEAPGRLRIRPAAEDAVLAYRHRLLQSGGERLIYRPTLAGVVLDYRDFGGPVPLRPERVKKGGENKVDKLKEVLFQELRREVGWRPQNDFWIPEALMREKS